MRSHVSIKQNQSAPVLARSYRSKNFFLCKNHYDVAKKWSWVPSNSSSCQFCINMKLEKAWVMAFYQNGKEIMEYLLILKSKNTGKPVNHLYKCSVQLVLQCIPTNYCWCYKIYKKNG